VSPVVMPPHSEELHEWDIGGGGLGSSSSYVATVPPKLARVAVALSPETAQGCARVGLELAVAARAHNVAGEAQEAARSLLINVEAVASSLIEGDSTSFVELAKSAALLPSTRASRHAQASVEALTAHLAAADRALGLGALAAAHTAPIATLGARRVASYRTSQTWMGGSDLWPAGADYVAPHPAHVSALMEDLVEFCARTDVDPIAQSAIAHAQFLSIQPFADANGRAARALINGVWRRRGLTRGLVVPVSAAIAGDRRRYGSAWRAYREGDAEPMIDLVAGHALRAVKEATASAGRIARMPEDWRDAARPRRGSAAHRLTAVLAAQPIVNAAEVQRLTSASQASAYDAIATLAEAGVLRRLSRSRRDTVWVASALIDEADEVTARLGGSGAGVH